ncbi:MAG: 23S rRNA (uracil(1939)-C(5))-methyltransferase RlmD [Bacteroidales bacterium]|nr:23S rRNA (uracil(1939)-C(5))-methyltransferase RlmD [Bacteroidales bacterium]
MKEKGETGNLIYNQVLMTDAGSEGKAVGRIGERVVFVPFAVPGDVVDIKIVKKRSRYMEGRVLSIRSPSPRRTKPVCRHFGICGGCKWQQMKYEDQLYFKQKQVLESLTRIGKFRLPEIRDIIPSKQIFNYRNKLEFTFLNRKWTDEPGGEDQNSNGLGFHVPGRYDKILDITECHLQQEPSGMIRNALRNYAVSAGLDHWDARNGEGFLRNLIIRNTLSGSLMVLMIIGRNEPELILPLMAFLRESFPEITSLFYAVNLKRNDSLSGLQPVLYDGEPYMTEEMDDLKFLIGPLSFFQTNSRQALELFRTVREFAGLMGRERVFDLYSGTGTIAHFIGRDAAHVTGIESVPEAVEHARMNARLNHMNNISFVAADIEKLFQGDYFGEQNRPDVIIADPPRAGMHVNVLKEILAAAPDKIVYVSCNPATQARDVTRLAAKFDAVMSQPLDMFPHTHHVENVMLLRLRETFQKQ